MSAASVRQLHPADAMLAEDMGRFYADPLGFVRYAYDWNRGELAGHEGPDAWQAEILIDIAGQVAARDFDLVHPVDPLRYAVSSGHGVGKSALTAWLVNWLLSTRPHAKGVVTANTVPQLKSKTWAEIVKWTRRCITAHWFDVQALSIACLASPATWRIDAQTCREENSEAFAGLHAANSTPFYIFDEASAVPGTIWEVAEGGLTDGEPMFFVFGNPTRAVGAFYDAVFGSRRHRWRTRTIDSRTTRIANKGLIAQWIADYGEDSDFVRVRARGLPPRRGSLQFIDGAQLDEARRREPQRQDFQPILVGVDVARYGDDQSVIRTRQGRDARSWPARKFRALDTMQLAARVVEHVEGIGRQRVGAVFVDGVGVGGPVVDRLRQLGLPNVIEVNAGAKSADLRYRNKRAECYARLRDWLPGASIDADEDLYLDLAAIEYGYTDDNRIALVSKEDTKAALGRSPDDADALALTFAEPVAPLTERHPGMHAGLQHDYDPMEVI